MPKIATEKLGLRNARAVQIGKLRASVSFYAFDGSFCLLIEGESAEDARYLCRDAGIEFIGLCVK
ncbi:MAG: hypothetical protein R6X03_07720 [Methyloceanibacter sp.]|jgi:hypothetical protein